MAMLLASGCGGGSRLLGSRSARSGAPPVAGARVASYTATVEPATGRITFQPDRSGVSAQATPYGGGDDIRVSGSATYASATAVLSGNVTVSSTNVIDFLDLRVVVAEISSSSVSVINADGVTTLIPNRNSDYWSYGRVNQSTPRTRNWQFRVPDGAGFTFRIQIWANAWKFSAGDGGTLQGLSFVSRTRGWAVGASGKILTTADGANWTPQVTNAGQHLFGVFFVDDQYGWAVGAGGAIVATTNGGRTWRLQNWKTSLEDNSVTLTAVRFANRDVGWTVGSNGTILRTTNGGASWSRVALGSAETFYDVACSGASMVWVVGEGPTVLRSSDGGQSFAAQSVPAGSQFVILTGVKFASSTLGIAVGTLGNAYRTTNGGATWTAIDCGVGTLNLQDVDFASSSLVYVSGQFGTLRRSRNGGQSWEYVESGVTNNIVALACFDTAFGWAAGSDGLVLRTANAGASDGASWSATLRGTLSSLNAVHFLNDLVGAAVGREGTLLLTTDGGGSWRQISSPAATTLTSVRLQSIGSATRIWIVGANSLLAYSDNSGAAWTARTVSGVSLNTTFFAIDFLNNSVGVVCGSGGAIGQTTNGGSTWTSRGSGLTAQSLNAVAFASTSNVWAVGSGGTILFSDDGGNSWSGTGSPAGDSLLGVAAVDDAHVWICGQNGRLFTLGGWGAQGPQWVIQTSGVVSALTGIDFVDPLRGWSVGAGGTLLRTDDGGLTWTSITSGINSNINAIQVRNPDDAWIVGANGLIQRLH